MSNKILIIEDDLDIQALIHLSLTSQHIGEADCASTFNEALKYLQSHTYDVILLDLNLHSESGYELLNEVDQTQTKVLIVTAKDTSYDVYRGFEEGAVDYIKKPFDPMEPAYRVKIHLKPKRDYMYQFKHLKVNFRTAEVWVQDEPANLTAREYDLLEYFISNPNRILSKEQLYAQVWGYETGVDDNTLMVHIRTLRKKVELTPNTPELIQTVRGKGYIYRGLINE